MGRVLDLSLGSARRRGQNSDCFVEEMCELRITLDVRGSKEIEKLEVGGKLWLGIYPGLINGKN